MLPDCGHDPNCYALGDACPGHKEDRTMTAFGWRLTFRNFAAHPGYDTLPYWGTHFIPGYYALYFHTFGVILTNWS